MGFNTLAPTLHDWRDPRLGVHPYDQSTVEREDGRDKSVPSIVHGCGSRTRGKWPCTSACSHSLESICCVRNGIHQVVPPRCVFSMQDAGSSAKVR